MCGRVIVSKDIEDLKLLLKNKYQINEFLYNFKLPRYNIAPGQELLTIIHDGYNYRAGTLKWGLIPSWGKDEKVSFINAQAETLSLKPSFRDSFKKRRCIILADGFYEWKKTGKDVIPMRFKMKNDDFFPIAGLWSSYTKSDGSKLFTCTIITTIPNELVSPVHDRMPAILTDEQEEIWLNPTISNTDILNSVLKPYDGIKMEVYQVSTIVNNPKNDIPECIEAIY